jgi:hypothetical protein
VWADDPNPAGGAARHRGARVLHAHEYCTRTSTTKRRTQRAEALKLAIGTLSTRPKRVDPPLRPHVLLNELKRAFMSFVHTGRCECVLVPGLFHLMTHHRPPMARWSCPPGNRPGYRAPQNAQRRRDNRDVQGCRFAAVSSFRSRSVSPLYSQFRFALRSFRNLPKLPSRSAPSLVPQLGD